MTVSLWQEWTQSAQTDFFNLISGGIFLIAVTHAFLVSKITASAKQWDKVNATYFAQSSRKRIISKVLHLLGEVEVVFGFWAIVLMLTLIFYPEKGWGVMINYLGGGDVHGIGSSQASKFIEPVFVMVVMVVGYTLLMSPSTLAINPATYKKLPYDAMKGFTHISGISLIPAMMAINSDVPAKTVKDFVALTKANPGKYYFISSGNGSAPQLFGEAFTANRHIDERQ